MMTYSRLVAAAGLAALIACKTPEIPPRASEISSPIITGTKDCEYVPAYQRTSSQIFQERCRTGKAKAEVCFHRVDTCTPEERKAREAVVELFRDEITNSIKNIDDVIMEYLPLDNRFIIFRTIYNTGGVEPAFNIRLNTATHTVTLVMYMNEEVGIHGHYHRQIYRGYAEGVPPQQVGPALEGVIALLEKQKEEMGKIAEQEIKKGEIRYYCAQPIASKYSVLINEFVKGFEPKK